MAGTTTHARHAPSSTPPTADKTMRDADLSVAYRLSAVLVVLLAVASGAGLFVPGLYRDAPAWAAQARGTDLVTLTLTVPALVAALTLAARGSLRAVIVWLGVLGYVLYMYVIAAFTVVFNPLFLVYVVVLSLSIFSLVAALPRLDADDLRARFARGLPVRPIAIYLLIVAALFFTTWMREIVPAIVGNTMPASLGEMNLPTNPVHVLDLSLLLPLAALSGTWLWQGRPWGYLLAGVLLVTLTIVGASVVSGVLFERRSDPTVSLAPMPFLVVVPLLGLSLLVVYLRHLRQVPDKAARQRIS